MIVDIPLPSTAARTQPGTLSVSRPVDFSTRTSKSDGGDEAIFGKAGGVLEPEILERREFQRWRIADMDADW